MLTAFVCCLGLCAHDQTADAKERIAELKKEIAALREEIASKEADIIRLSPPKKVPYLFLGNTKPGMLGPFGARFVDAAGAVDKMDATIRVEEIIDGKTMIVSVMSKQKSMIGRIAFDPHPMKVVVSNYDTERTSPGAKFLSPPFLVLGNRVIDGVTYLHVDRYKAPSK